MLFSSLAVVLGGLGFTGYAAANAYLDALSQAIAADGDERWISIDWDTWRICEGQHGILGATVAPYEMVPEDGIEILQRVLALDPPVPQVVISTGDLDERLGQWVHNLATHTDEARRAPRPDLSRPFAPPRTAIEKTVAAIWESVLGIHPVGIHDQFLELGGHSLIGTRLVTRIRRAFEVAVPLTILFDAPTVAELAIAIELALIAEIEAMRE